jgi:hypothetical protein
MDCVAFGLADIACRSDGGAAMVGRPFLVQLPTPPERQLVTRQPEERELRRVRMSGLEMSIVRRKALKSSLSLPLPKERSQMRGRPHE